MQVINKLYLLLFCLLLFVIPFTDLGEAIPNILIIGLSVLFPFVFKIKYVTRLNIYVFIALVLLTGIAFFELLYFNRWEDIKLVSRLSFLMVIYVLSTPILVKEFVKKMMYSFLIGVSLLLIISIYTIFKEYLLGNNFSLSVGGDINRILLGDRPYIGFLYVIGVFISLYLMFNLKNKFRKTIMGILSVILICFLFLITARTSIISLALAGILSVFYIKDIKIKLSILLGTILMGLSLFFFNQNFKSRLTLGFKQDKISIEKIMKLEPRYYIWSCVNAIRNEKSPSFFGYGFTETQNKLNDCYSETQEFYNSDQQAWFLDKKFNTHNQYLNIYLSTGSLGLIILIVICIYCLVCNMNSFYGLGINLSMLMFFMFENVLSRQMGIELCALVLVFSSGISMLEREENKSPRLAKPKNSF